MTAEDQLRRALRESMRVNGDLTRAQRAAPSKPSEPRHASTPIGR